MARDVDLFKAAMADVTPLRGRRKAQAPAPSTIAPPARPRGATDTDTNTDTDKVSPPGRAAPAAERRPAAAFDRDVDRALARGRRAPQATLDLHGMTLVAAERTVARFLEEAVALDLRLVLIVTGKGLREVSGRIAGGRIREEFPAWLNRVENRAKVRALKPAHLRHGGSGAFYVLLRRRRLP
jgi:DNA-nicking Smr family endonuclease